MVPADRLDERQADKERYNVSVIIPTYNRRPILQKCLEHLANQTLEARCFEVIVVDDASTDDTAQMIRELTVPYTLRYIPLDERTGPGGARNVGIEAAQADVIVFLDSDLIPAPQLLAAHCEVHREHLNRIGHGAVIHTTDFDNPTATPMKLTDISRAFFATGNVSIRKEHLVNAGLFDTDFKEYGWEDLELGRRLRRLGLTAVPVPEAKGWHFKHALRLEQLPRLIEQERQRARTAWIYYQKHPEVKVRASIELMPFIFRLDKLFSIGGWPDKPGTYAYLSRLEQAGKQGRLRFLVRLITHHAYMAELRRIIPQDHPAREFVR
jgi:glycosyltransferase involved in cell wall biosynthesis